MLTTPGQLLVNEILPEELRDYSSTLGQDEINDRLRRLAETHPDKYRDVTWKMVQLGRNAAFDEGSTITLNDLVPVVNKAPLIDVVRQKEKEIYSNPALTPDQKEEAIETLYGEATKRLTDETYNNALANNNPFAIQAKYKARGNKNQLGALLTSPGTYTDSTGKIVPIFISSAYAEGLKPHEYWAAGYGARLGVVGTKLGTQKGGYLSKMMNAAAIDQVVTTDDCGTSCGVPVDVNDGDSVGAVLQVQAGGFKPGTVITKKVLDEIKESGADEIVVRSPMTCGCKDGLCKRCVGIRETGKFPEIGYNVGVNAASALGEQIAQTSLNCLAEGTLVRMADGSAKPIEQVNVGDTVLGSDMCGNLSPTKVVARYDNGVQPCVDTTFVRNGDSGAGAETHLVSTTEHPILATRVMSGSRGWENSWIPSMIKVGTRVKLMYAYAPSGFDDTGLRTERFAFVLGVMSSKWCAADVHGNVDITRIDEATLARLNSELSGRGVMRRLKRRSPSAKQAYRISLNPKGAETHAASSKRVFCKYDVMYRKGERRRTPVGIWLWDNKSIGAYIAGVIAVSGYVYPGANSRGVTIRSDSRAFLEELDSIMLARFGIMSSGVHAAGKRVHALHLNRIPAILGLAKVVGNVCGRQARLDRLVGKISDSGTPHHSAFFRKSQVETGRRHVYDIEVEHPNHIYLLANGLIVHNTKHSGKRSDLGSYVGFDALKNLTTIPKEYDAKASVATRDGTVTGVEEAPQGGRYVILDNDVDSKVYVPQSLKVSVKEGDVLEAGDAVSSGLVSPAEVVGYKGIGEGRRYFANRFRQVFKDSHYGVNRRNVEVLSRALINNVQVENPDSEGAALPGDVVRYSSWAGEYTPRDGAEDTPVDKSVGRYLETPALHYTIGTKITPSVVKALKRHGTTSVLTNHTSPGVSPSMVSIVESPAYSNDWMARLGTSYLKKRLLEDAQRGSSSNPHGINPIPSLARGVEFGDGIADRGEY